MANRNPVDSTVIKESLAVAANEKQRRLAQLRRFSGGFNLLEMVLVIAVVAVLVLFAMRVTQREQSHSRIEHAGQELQSVMQAAIYYRSVNQQWPENNIDASCSSQPSTQRFATYYLPKDAAGDEEKSSFGTYYCWQQHTSTGVDAENAALFDIYLPVRGSSACQLAKQIAGTVPNAHAMAEIGSQGSETCSQETEYYVRAQVVPAAQGGGGSSGSSTSGQSFQSMGECVPESAPECGDGFAASADACCHVSGSSPTQYKIHFASCSSGQTPKVIYLSAFISYMYSETNYSPQTVFDRDYLYYQNTGKGTDPKPLRSRNPVAECSESVASGQTECVLTLGVGMHTAQHGVVDLTNPVDPYKAGSVGAVYMVACVNEQTGDT